LFRDAENEGWNHAAHMERYALNQSLMLAEHGVCFLLRKLIEHVPDKADEIAAEMWGGWEDPPLVALTWPVLESYGIDPQAVADAAQKRWQTATAARELQQAVREAALASPEVHPDQTVIPAGGES
jgi:hypothetical protein